MEGIPRIESPAPSESRQRLRAAFTQIEQKARLSGNGAVLMELDRVPGLLLGPENKVEPTAEEGGMNEAYAALERILRQLERAANGAVGSDTTES